MTAPGAADALSRRPLSSAFRPFIGSILKGSSGSNLAVRRKGIEGYLSSSAAPQARIGRLLHHDEARALQMLHEPLGDDLGHDLVGVVDALAALEAQGEGENMPVTGSYRGGTNYLGRGISSGVHHQAISAAGHRFLRDRFTSSAASTFRASATRPSTVTVIDACARSI
jgi:hypothetical protein